jgi:hypothetical protein
MTLDIMYSMAWLWLQYTLNLTVRACSTVRYQE